MPRDILLYENIDMFSSSEFINAINELEEAEITELITRINTNGGEPAYMWGMVAKFSEFVGKKMVKVDGKAFSGGLFFLCYCDDAECLDVSQGLLHRAAYPDWFEANAEYFTEELRANLSNMNKNLETAFRNKVDVTAFENLKQVKEKNITVKDIFSMDSRIDVFLSAKDMKKIGLVNRIVTITPAIKTEIESRYAVISAKHTGAPTPEPIVKPVTKNVMTLEEFRIAHPGVFAEIVALGIAQERDRVEGIMVFNHIAPEVCKSAVESGKNLTEKQKNEIALAQMSKTSLNKIKDENAAAVTTDEQPNTRTELTADQKKAKEKADFESKVLADFKTEVVN